ncbi:MAG: hypothetical protein LBT40_10155, partial [Deltaproteobacteria bacterium]|nr:hypothetical protein [Deltaproteobacteria bacterium]
ETAAITDAFRNPEPSGNGHDADRGGEPLLPLPLAGSRDGDAGEHGTEPLLFMPVAGSLDGDAGEHAPEPHLLMSGAESLDGNTEEQAPEPLLLMPGAGSLDGDAGEHGTEPHLLMPGAGSRDGDAGEHGTEPLLLMPGAGSRDGDDGEHGPEPLLLMPMAGSRDGEAEKRGKEPPLLMPVDGSRDGEAEKRGPEPLLLMPLDGSRDGEAEKRGKEPVLPIPGDGDAGERGTEPLLLMPGAGSRDFDDGDVGPETHLLMPGAGTLAEGQPDVPLSGPGKGSEDVPECLVASPGGHKGATFFGHVLESADGRHALAVTDTSGRPVGAAWTGKNARLTSRGVRQASVRLRELAGAARIILVGSPGRARRRGGIRIVHVQKRFAGLDDRLWTMLGTDGVTERLAAGCTLDVAGAGKGKGGQRELVIQRPGFGDERRLDFAEALADTARLVNGSDGARPVGMRTASLQTAAATGWKGIERYFMKESPRDGTSKWALIPETVDRFRAVLGLCAFTTTVPAPTLPPALAGATVARHLELRERAAEIGGDLRALVRGVWNGGTGSAQDSAAFLADPDAWKDFSLAAYLSPAATGTRKDGTSGGGVPASAATLLDGIRKGTISAALDSLKDFASHGLATGTASSQTDGIRKESVTAATTSSLAADYSKGTVPAAFGSLKDGIGTADDVLENSVRMGAVTHEALEITSDMTATKKQRAEGKPAARRPASAAKGKSLKRKSSPSRKRSSAGKSAATEKPSPKKACLKGSGRPRPAMTRESQTRHEGT